MQPQTIFEAFFTGTEHLINFFTTPVKLKSRHVPNMLSCFWTFIDIGVHERKILELFA
jgi:hypothetical protein